MKNIARKLINDSVWRLVLLAFLTIIVQSQSVFISYIMGDVIDELTMGNYDAVLHILIIATMFMITITLFSTFNEYFLEKVRLMMQQKLKLSVFDHLFRSKSTDASEPSGALCEKINTDTKNCVNYIAFDCIQVIMNVVMLVMITLILVWIDWQLCIVLFILALINIATYMGTYQKLVSAKTIERDAQTASFSRELMWLSKQKLMKLENLFHYACDSLHSIYEQCQTALKRSKRISSVYDLFCSLISSLSLIAIIFISMLHIKEGDISVGKFIIAFNFYSMLMDNLSKILNFGAKKQEYEISCHRLDSYVTSELESCLGITLPTIHQLSLKNASIRYQDQVVLENFSYDFHKGCIYLIQGDNGCGKSSLLDVLSGLLECEYDEFKVNGEDFRDYNLTAYRAQHISYATQALYLIEGSVEENITFDRPRCENMLFPLEYLMDKQAIDENLSGGEKRKIILNRAFSKDTDVLLLDEPESFLDQDMKRLLISYLESKKKDHIIIIVSHANEFQSIADEIIHLAS